MAGVETSFGCDGCDRAGVLVGRSPFGLSKLKMAAIVRMAMADIATISDGEGNDGVKC